MLSLSNRYLLGELGTTAKEVESTLSGIFAISSKWKAILLLDEADTFVGTKANKRWSIATRSFASF